MHKAIVVPALTVAVACWSCQSETNRPHEITVQGCIAQQGENYVLTSDSGTKYVLTGDQKQAAQAQAGHEALVRGQLVYDTKTPGGPPATSSHPYNQLEVATVQVVSDNCRAAH
jgi:hypothetical protein